MQLSMKADDPWKYIVMEWSVRELQKDKVIEVTESKEGK